MFRWIFITQFLLYVNYIQQCVGVQITGLFFKSDDGFPFLERTLFSRNTTMPKSYVVGFKYSNDAFGELIYSGRIYSNAPNTWGSGYLNNGDGDIYAPHVLNAEIHIPNATKFKVGVQLNGMMGIGHTGMERFLRGIKIFRPRSGALICVINEKKPHTKYRELLFGARKDGDTILYAKAERFSSSNSELPRHKIEFEDNSAIITAVSIKLKSTRAIVFHNKVQLKKHRFSATIYGLNNDAISSTVIIYGHQT